MPVVRVRVLWVWVWVWGFTQRAIRSGGGRGNPAGRGWNGGPLVQPVTVGVALDLLFCRFCRFDRA